MEIFGEWFPEGVETALAAGIFVASVVVAVVVAVVIGWIVRLALRPFAVELGHRLSSGLRRPVILFISLQGAFVALRMLPSLEGASWLTPAWLVATSVVVIFVIQHVIGQLLLWLGRRRPDGERTRIDPRSLPLVRRGVSFTIWVVGALIVLDTLNVAISPLLAGLGIGGIAVALALQPLLVNLFASSYMLSDQSIRIGDYVEVLNGASGVIEDIGWRATRIRSVENNIALVPNSVLAGATVTNFAAPDPQVATTIRLAVGAESDLARVEERCIEEMRALRDESDYAVKWAEPALRFEGFGDGRVQMLLRMRANNWRDALLLRHLLVKRVHALLVEDGVTIR